MKWINSVADYLRRKRLNSPKKEKIIILSLITISEIEFIVKNLPKKKYLHTDDLLLNSTKYV